LRPSRTTKPKPRDVGQRARISCSTGRLVPIHVVAGPFRLAPSLTTGSAASVWCEQSRCVVLIGARAGGPVE
jgi:hypothetical protein